MPRRINAETDMSILADIGIGMLYKDIAEKYKVSPSYVSKLARGKKVPDIHIPKPEIETHDDFTTYTHDLEAIIKTVETYTSKVDPTKIVEYLERFKDTLH